MCIFFLIAVTYAVDYETEIQPIFNNNCGNCHLGNSSGDVNLSSYENTMNSDVITPGNHEQSTLWDEINSGNMPQGNNPELSEEEIDLIAQWIDEGALPEENNDISGCMDQNAISCTDQPDPEDTDDYEPGSPFIETASSEQIDQLMIRVLPELSYEWNSDSGHAEVLPVTIGINTIAHIQESISAPRPCFSIPKSVLGKGRPKGRDRTVLGLKKIKRKRKLQLDLPSLSYMPCTLPSLSSMPCTMPVPPESSITSEVYISSSTSASSSMPCISSPVFNCPLDFQAALYVHSCCPVQEVHAAHKPDAPNES